MKHIFQRTCRCGVSLLELLVIMSAASVILSLSAGLIHRIMHAETKARSLAAVERASLRLAEAFRGDVRTATHAVTDQSQLADGVFVRLDSAGGKRVEYRRDGQAIHRIQLDGDRIIARDEFTFPAEFDLNLHADGSRLVVLTITSRKADREDQQGDPVRIANAITIDLHVVAALERGSP